MWTTALKWIVGKAGAAGTLISPFALYIKVGIFAVLAGLLSAHLWNDHNRKIEVRELQESLGAVTQAKAQALRTAQRNGFALEECLAANAFNAEEALTQRERAVAAVAEVELLRAMNDRDKVDIIREGEELRGRDDECRTLDDTLPDWFLDGLWDDN